MAVPLAAQFGLDPGRAIDPALGRKDPADMPAQFSFRLRAALSGRDRAQPRVEAANTRTDGPGTALQRHGWRARLPQRRTCSRDPLGEKSRGLTQDQVLVLKPLHLALEAQHLGFIRLLLGQRLSRASGQLLIAPLAQLARADIQLRSDVSEWQATLDHTLNRLGLVLPRKSSPGPPICHTILLGCSGSLQNPPLRRRKPRVMVKWHSLAFACAWPS